jgi:hypothetical protein
MRFLKLTPGISEFAQWIRRSKLDSKLLGRRATGVWSIVRIPPDTLADGKVKKHPFEYGVLKVFIACHLRVRI